MHGISAAGIIRGAYDFPMPILSAKKFKKKTDPWKHLPCAGIVEDDDVPYGTTRGGNETQYDAAVAYIDAANTVNLSPSVIPKGMSGAEYCKSKAAKKKAQQKQQTRPVSGKKYP